MKTTRQKLLENVKNRPGITAAELSRALKVTQSDVRHHLSIMIDEGLVVTAGQESHGKRGRPARRFSLSVTAQRDNFDLLSSSLLKIYFGQHSPEERTTYLRQVASNLSGGPEVPGPLAQRLVAGVQTLNKLGYQARWEAHAVAPRIIFEHCPFAALRTEHPELCQLDTYLVEHLLDEQVYQQEASAHRFDGICLFLVGESRSPIE